MAAGSAMAAELGVMKVYEEIDALKTLDIDPVRYLGNRSSGKQGHAIAAAAAAAGADGSTPSSAR